MSNRWQGTLGLTLSKTEGSRGRTTRAARPRTTARTAPPAPGLFGQNPNDYVNADGRLMAIGRCWLKAQLVYEVGWGDAAAQLPVSVGPALGARDASGGLGIPGATRVLFEPFSGNQRVNAINQLDIRLEKALRFGGNVEGAVFGDLLNVTNSGGAQNMLDRRSTEANFGVGSVFVPPVG